MIPSREECLTLLKKHGYYNEHIPIIHAELVEKVALHISDLLISKDVKVDKKIVGAAALIHDIGKEDKGYADHAIRGYNICIKEGLDPRICLAVKNHDVEGVMHVLGSWEEKIVSYSDKICNTKILGLEGRFHDWIDRFPEYYEKHKTELDKSHTKSLLLEKEILNKLGLNSEELYDILREEK
jgi:putative nucleotidyltransferase with HDIG domain